MDSIFNYDTYVEYLKFISGGKARSGFWASVAKAADVNSAFISQIVTGKKHLSLEQAEKISRFLNLTNVETEYFLILIQKDRAGTHQLKKFFEKKILDFKEKYQSNIKSRLENFEELSESEQAAYYSHWIYSAVHIAITIPSLRNAKSISEFMNYDKNLIADALEYLNLVGLVKNNNGEYLPTKKMVHLSRQSNLIRQHHVNWRLKALNTIEFLKDENIHYSVVVSLSEKDFHLFKEKLIKLIKEFMSTVKDSPEEILSAFNFDFFKLN